MPYFPKPFFKKSRGVWYVEIDRHQHNLGPDRDEAERQLLLAREEYHQPAPKLVAWMENNVPQGLTVFVLAASHRRKLRTTNMLERLNKEIKRRTRVATLFPNESSLLRLVSAVLIETSEEWKTGKTYLKLESD